MKPKIFLLLGDWGYVFSMGFVAWGKKLEEMGYDVEVIADSGKALGLLVDKIYRVNQPIALVGYSLGGNGVAWACDQIGRDNKNLGYKQRIELAVAVDPTQQGTPLDQYPLGPHVKRAITVRNTGWGRWFPTSWFTGASQLHGPQVETIDVSAEHVTIQFLSSWRRPVEQALNLIKGM